MSAHAEMTFLQLLYYVLIAGMKEHVGGLGAELLICEGLRDWTVAVDNICSVLHS